MKTRKILVVLAVLIGVVLAACTPGFSLNNTGWTLETLNGQPVVSGTQPTLNFEDGAFNGTDGCNQYSGMYTRDGENITVNKDIVATMMACAEPIMQQSSAYLAALTQAATYQVDGQQLTLLDASGKALATFTQTPAK